MAERIMSVLYDLADLLGRHDINSAEKWRILFALIALKFSPGNRVSFLGYTVEGDARANIVGILKEVFLKGDYAFKSDTDAPNIIDAGGNIGITTLFFKRQFPKSTVQTFEAAPRNHELLQKNVEENHLGGVRVVFGALGLTRGTRSMFFNTKKPGGSTMSAAVADTGHSNAFLEEQVPALCLSDYITEDVDLLKLDVEGAESEILQELETSGALTRVKQIVMEFHANQSNKANALIPLLSLLEKSGFGVVIYDNEHGAHGKRLARPSRYHFMIRAYR